MVKLKRNVQRTRMSKPIQLAKLFGIHSVYVEYRVNVNTFGIANAMK